MQRENGGQEKGSLLVHLAIYHTKGPPPDSIVAFRSGTPMHITCSLPFGVHSRCQKYVKVDSTILLSKTRQTSKLSSNFRVCIIECFQGVDALNNI